MSVRMQARRPCSPRGCVRAPADALVLRPKVPPQWLTTSSRGAATLYRVSPEARADALKAQSTLHTRRRKFCL